MTAIIILGVIFALISLILAHHIKISILYENSTDDGLAIKLHVLFLSFPIILPASESHAKTKVNPKKFTYKKYQKLLKKELKKQKKTAAAKKKPSESKASEVSNAPQMLGILKTIIIKISRKFFSHLKADIYRFRITLGGENAAKTAITYGIVYQSVLYIFEILDSFCVTFRDKRKSNVSVDTDFTSEKTTADIKILFKIRIIHLIGILISAFANYIKNTQKQQESNHE